MEEIKEIDKKNLLAPKLRFGNFKGNWGRNKLGAISDISKLAGYEYTKHVVYSDIGKTIALRAMNIKKNSLDLREVKYIDCSDFSKLGRSKLFIGDLMFTYIGANIGDVALINENDRFYHAPNVARIRSNSKFLNYNYLIQYFNIPKFLKQEIYSFIASSSQPALSMESLRKFEISIPALPEQQKIASFLSAVDEKIQQLCRKKELLVQYKKGVMQQLFSGNLRFTNENGKAFSKWEEKILDNIIERTSTGLNPRKNFLLGSGNNYYVTIKNISNGKLDFSNAERINDEAIELIKKRSDLRKNDIIMASIGNVGDAYLLNYDPNNWNINESVFMLRASNKILPKYLYYIITNDFSKRYFESNSTGSSFKSIKLRELKLLPINLPNIIEQKKIADYLSNLDNKIDSVNTQITQTQNFKKGLLQQMFV